MSVTLVNKSNSLQCSDKIPDETCYSRHSYKQANDFMLKSLQGFDQVQKHYNALLSNANYATKDQRSLSKLLDEMKLEKTKNPSKYTQLEKQYLEVLHKWATELDESTKTMQDAEKYLERMIEFLKHLAEIFHGMVLEPNSSKNHIKSATENSFMAELGTETAMSSLLK
ncbi:hypothetical protein SOPP22_17410 [Shewanella sp. OPT22]|nr:hypothetical protein SOPP22_17410 [Shewanella sp. OPT22]